MALVQLIDLTVEDSDEEEYDALVSRELHEDKLGSNQENNKTLPTYSEAPSSSEKRDNPELVQNKEEINEKKLNADEDQDELIQPDNDKCDSLDSDHDQEECNLLPMMDPEPPILHRSAPFLIDNEQPCTSSSLRSLIQPALKEFIRTPGNSPPHKPTRVYKKSPAFTNEQTVVLRAAYKKDPHPSAIDTLELMTVTGLTKTSIQRWFRDQRATMKRHENLKEGKNTCKRMQSKPVTAKEPTGASANTTPSAPKRQRQSEPPPPPRGFDEDENCGTTLEDKIDCRMNSIKIIGVERISQELKNSEDRVIRLVKLFMRPELNMKQTLLKETIRLNEMSLKISPFTSQQMQCIKAWQDRFFNGLVNAPTKEQKRLLVYAQKHIVEVWHPKMIYAKLVGRSLDAAIKDFTFNSAGRMVGKSSGEYYIPAMLRYDWQF